MQTEIAAMSASDGQVGRNEVTLSDEVINFDLPVGEGTTLPLQHLERAFDRHWPL